MVDSRVRAKSGAPGQILWLGALIFVVFGLAFWAPFIYDDVPFISQNSDVLGSWQSWKHFLLKPNYYQEGYEPVSLLIHRALFLVGGASPALFRLSNILLHWSVCALLLLLFEELLGPGGPAFWLAALFAVFPSHTENIAVSTFKKHILVALFGLLMLRAERPWKPDRPSWARRAACALFLALGLFSKENAAGLPAILAAVSLSLAPDWKARLKRDGWFYAALLGIDLAFLYWRAVVVPRVGAELVGNSPVTHLLTAAKCLVWYFREFLWPVRLCQEHSIDPLALSWSWQLFAVVGALGALAAFAAWLWRRDRVAFAGFAIAVLWMLPFLNLIPYLNLSLVANRYIYLSMAGILLCAGRLSRPYWDLRLGRFKAVPLACSALGLCYAGLAMNNLGHYSDPLEVWERAAACAPGNPRAHQSLGALYAQRRLYAEAEKEFRTTARIDHGVFDLYAADNLGLLFAQTGRPDQAVYLFTYLGRHYSKILRFDSLGTTLLGQGKLDGAVHALQQALYNNPRDHFSRLNLGNCFVRQKKERLAEIEWKAIEETDDAGPWALKNLGQLYTTQNRLPEARRALERSLQANPNQLDATRQLAEVDAKLGRAQDGLAAFDRLVEGIRRGQKLAFASASELTPAEFFSASTAVAAALRERSLFLARHPRLVASKG